MDYKESLDYINNSSWFGAKPGLERISELLEKLGSPQNGLKFIHIAGTNGKGSCAAMTAAVMKAAGYRTGLFTSPYLYSFNERMQINGKQIENDVLAEVMTRVCAVADGMDDHPTAFEIMTAAGLLWFSAQKCDIVVLEVGLGGRFDATNVISSPEVAVIMNIGLDHTEILGDTLEKIALEKSGIIKPGCDCVLYNQSEEVEAVIKSVCSEAGAVLHISAGDETEPEFDSLDGQVFTYKGNSYAIPLLGAHQRRNTAVVIEVAEVLRAKGWTIEQSELEHGLYSVFWPARFEVLSDDPYFVLDGGHNPQCASTVVSNLADYFPGVKHVMLVGVLKDKDYEKLFSILNLASDEFFCVTPDNPRALKAQDLADYLARFGKPVTVCDTIEDGVFSAADRAREIDGMVCAVGSLYIAGEIRACLGMY